MQSYILTFYAPNLDQNRWRVHHDALWNTGKFLYIGSQLERCPQTGRLHWQAFVKFRRDSKQRKTWFHSFVQGVHAEVVSKERAEAINYGTKEETRVEGPAENGERPIPTNCAHKWEELKNAILDQEIEKIPFDYIIRFRLENRLDGIRALYQRDEREPLPYWLPNPWGKLLLSKKHAKQRHYWIFSRQPNKGKTYLFAKPLANKFKITIQNGDFQYWNVKPNDEGIILDEYNTPSLKWSTLNSICDGTYQFRRIYQAKLCLKDPLVIVLSNQSIMELYPYAHIFLSARFIEIELL